MGASFSLWRAVFQADAPLDRVHNQVAATSFLDKLIRDNAITYTDERNSWSYGYYIGNARFRIIRMFDELNPSEKTTTLSELVDRNRTASNAIQGQSQAAWENAFKAVSCLIDILEQRIVSK
jgi:hypothetical protein